MMSWEYWVTRATSRQVRRWTSVCAYSQKGS